MLWWEGLGLVSCSGGRGWSHALVGGAGNMRGWSHALVGGAGLMLWWEGLVT